MVGPYQYKPLPSTRHFRLLRLTGRVGEHFHCDLVTYEIDEAPAYYGLSYCWGSVKDKVAIECNGRILRISTGLAEALEHLSEFKRERDVDFLWINQICVDQNNLSERSQQVQLMRDIYAGGRRTLIWLGPYEQDNGSKALALLERIDRARISSGYTLDGRLYPQATMAECERLGILESGSAEWYLLEHFFAMSWFTRVWVAQEAALSRCDPLLLWGEIVLEWAFIATIAPFALNRGLFEVRNRSLPAMHTVNFITSIRALRDERTGRPKPWTLDTLLNSGASGGAVCATDSRDQIYAYLGLASSQGNGRNTSHMLVPDYGQEPLAVFRDAARYCIEESGQLTVLGRGGISTCGDWSLYNCKNGPSWVPRWDIPTQTVLGKAVHRRFNLVFKGSVSTHEEKEMYRAAATLSAQIMDTQDTSQLCLWGMKVDTISWTTAVLPIEGFTTWASNPMAGIWDSMLNCFATMGLHTPNQPLGQLCRAFFMAVCAGWAPDDSMAPEHPMYKVYKELAVGGDTRRLFMNVAEKKIFVSSLGRIGQGPAMLQLNDEIWVLYGGATCYVLRNNGDGTHEFIGEAYVHGLMQGEAIQMLKDGLLEETTVTLV
ncbi:hypothetical protein LTR70_000440 [Exophiala xenobiotica]|nr:hypothetical protein LTR70_000440 [Exophiala xenobiotica]